MDCNKVLEQLWWIDKIAGGVWIILSGILIWILGKTYSKGFRITAFRVGLSLLAFIWLYPLYTGFFQNIVLGEIGNIVTLLFTLFFYFVLRKKHKGLSNWMLPQTVWLSIATIYLGLRVLNHGNPIY